MERFECLETLEVFYRAEKERLLALERNCHSHDWVLSEDHYTKKEAYGFKTVGQGSHVWTEPVGYRDVHKMRYKRKCKKCGKTEYTEKMGTKTVPTGPDFGDT